MNIQDVPIFYYLFASMWHIHVGQNAYVHFFSQCGSTFEDICFSDIENKTKQFHQMISLTLNLPCFFLTRPFGNMLG